MRTTTEASAATTTAAAPAMPVATSWLQGEAGRPAQAPLPLLASVDTLISCRGKQVIKQSKQQDYADSQEERVSL